MTFEDHQGVATESGRTLAGGKEFHIGDSGVNPNSRNKDETLACCSFTYGLSGMDLDDGTPFKGLWFSMTVTKSTAEDDFPHDPGSDSMSNSTKHKGVDNLWNPAYAGSTFPTTYFVGTVAQTDTWYWSDDRLKHNEEPINNALEIIRLLNPIVYDKTNIAYDEDYNGYIPPGTSFKEAGLIAQEILKIPDLEQYVKEGAETHKYGESEMIQIYGLGYNSIFTSI